MAAEAPVQGLVEGNVERTCRTLLGGEFIDRIF
jgi:hypothetical protein